MRNAKVRMQERSAKVRADQGDGAKRRRLEDIEDRAMKEEDPDKLANLFEQYRAEYLGERSANDEDDKRRRSEGGAAMEERASGSQQPAVYAETEMWRRTGRTARLMRRARTRGTM